MHKIQEPMLGSIIAASIYSKLAAFYKGLKMSDQMSNFDLLYAFNIQFDDKAYMVFIFCSRKCEHDNGDG